MEKEMQEEIKKGFSVIHTELEKMFVATNKRVDDLTQRLLTLESKFDDHTALTEYCPHKEV